MDSLVGFGERTMTNENTKIRKVVEQHIKGSASVGSYLAQRLVSANASTFFTVAGDYIPDILNSLLCNSSLTMVGCCNELNAGYAADGYCRETGQIGVVVVTYMVGGLSAMNAIVGAYSEDLPVLLISGGPDTNDESDQNVVHHTIKANSMFQASKCIEPIVSKTFVIRHINDAAKMIDDAILTVLSLRKPVYLEIPVNLCKQLIASPSPNSFIPNPKISDSLSLKAAAADIQCRLKASNRPVVLAGSSAKAAGAMEELDRFNTVLGSGYINLPEAKGTWNESNPLFLGTYWSTLSTPSGMKQAVEDSDLVLLVGATLNDHTSEGWTSMIKTQNFIEIFPRYVIVCCKLYSNVHMAHLLAAFTKIPLKDGSLKKFIRNNATSQCNCDMTYVPFKRHTPLIFKEVQLQIQHLLSSITSLIFETGDSWCIGQEMIIPDGAKCHYQMTYGSTGWAVCAALGVAMGVGNTRKVVVLTCHRAFQMSAQEVSTMIKQRANIIIFVINSSVHYNDSGGIHHKNLSGKKGPWNYAEFMTVLDSGEGVGIGVRARTSNDLSRAISSARSHKGVYLIEVIIDRIESSETHMESKF